MSDQIKYYFKEDTNQILVSGSDNRDGMNVLLNSIKNANTINTGPATANNTVRLSSLGENTQWVVDNDGQEAGDTTITIGADQELWLYRGWQPSSTLDANAYRYNPHLHRPYKAYILTETGGGSSGFPWSPEGNTPFSDFPGGTGINIPNVFDEKYLASNGSETQDGINSTAIVKGKFTVSEAGRNIYPWIFTRYSSNISSTREGSLFYLYKENTDSTYNSVFYTSIGVAASANAVIFDSATVASITEVILGNITQNAQVLNSLVTNMAQGKPMGELVFTQGADNVTGTVTSIVQSLYNGIVIYTLGLSSVTSTSATVPFANGSTVAVKFQNFPLFVGTPISQQQTPSATNTTPQLYSQLRLNNAVYTYTSSVFDGDPSGQYYGIGFSQFGLYAEDQWNVQYKATNSSGGTVRIYFTDVNNDPKYYDLADGFNVSYYALTGTPYFDPASPTDFSNVIINPTGAPVPRPDITSFQTRVNDVYIAYSSSLTQSIDGLYVFNQIPQSDVQVTVSMFVDAWRGETEGAKYGLTGGINTDTTYSIDVATPPDPPTEPTYGEGETGDGPTWTTASIRLYTGTYPNAVPTVLDDYLYEEAFESEIIHINGLSITSSYLIPKADISLKTCLSVALQVSTGSNTPASDVENSLVVRNYNIEFNTPGTDENDGSVPVFLDGALSGGETLANTPDCQPLYNVYVTDETLRRNPLIQEVEYNIPESFFLLENQELIPFIYPFTSVGSLNAATATYTQASGQIITSGVGTGIVLNISTVPGGKGIIVTVGNPGSGYQNGDTLRIAAATLVSAFGASMTQDLLINLNFVFGLYNPSNFKPILENTAIKSSVPESNYTQLSSITPRYLGSRTTADNVNSVLNLEGGFGTLPVIDYKTAFFAYCDQVVDPYPTVNDQTLFNIKYLINEGGDPKQPNLSPYTAFDIEGSWEEGGVGRVGINQISGSTQYDALNNLQPISLVAKQIVPYFWSQTGNNSFAETAIPMNGKRFNDISNDFLQYGMTVAGNLYNANNANLKNPTLGDNFFTSATDTFNNQTFNKAFNWGIYGSTENTVSHSFATGSSEESGYSEMGEMFFNNDQYAINNLNDLTIPDLSDDYTIGTDFIFPAGTPSNTTLSKQLGGQNVGSIEIRLQYLDQPVGAALASWPTEVFQTYTQPIRVDTNREVEIELFYGDKDINGNVPSINTKTERYSITEMFGSVASSINSRNPVNSQLPLQYVYTLNINFAKFNQFLANNGSSAGKVNFVKYHIPLQTIGSIPSNRRFRWKVEQKINYLATVNQNGFNPTKVLGANLNNAGAPIYPPVEGPFFTATISGTKQFPADDTNLIKRDNTSSGGIIGYWKFFNSGIGFKNNATLTPSNSSTGTGYAIGGVATTSNLITITDAMTSTSGASGGQIALTTNTVGEFASALLVQADSNQYATNTVITIPESVLQQSQIGLNTAGTGNAIITLTPASTEDIGTGTNNILELQPESANNLYNDTLGGNPYFMGTLPYTASANILFPGGQEPSDTAFPELGIPFQMQEGDEIRFLNDETQSYSIVTVTPPADTVNSKLRITLLPNKILLEGSPILAPGINLDFFLMRRTIPSPNTIYVDRPFPYGTLPTIKKFVDSTNQSFGDTPAFAGSSYPTQATSQGSGSFIEYTEPLRKSDNTPAGILFPEYPTALIDLTPDEILKNLRDNKLIE